MRPVLFVGGAPQLQVDAVRYMSVHASGDTAVQLSKFLHVDHACTLLLSSLVHLDIEALRYTTRQELEQHIQAFIKNHPDCIIVMSAAVNDYEVSKVSSVGPDDSEKTFKPGEKVPSGAKQISITLEPTSKLVDNLASYGHRGPLIAFKYEDKSTVISSAQNLLKRTGARAVLANSLCASVQAVVLSDHIEKCDDRETALAYLAELIKKWATD